MTLGRLLISIVGRAQGKVAQQRERKQELDCLGKFLVKSRNSADLFDAFIRTSPTPSDHSTFTVGVVLVSRRTRSAMI